MAATGTERVGRADWITLVAMTLSSSMILVDQTAVPLATPHVIGDVRGTSPRRSGC